MKHKLVPVAAALLTALTSYNVAAESATDILTDGWEVHGYGSMNFRFNEDLQSFDSELGKPDYRTAGTSGKSANQIEFVLKKHTEFANGVYSDFVTRTEYGNGDSFYYTSSGAEKANTKAQLEIKEAYVALGNLPYLGEGTEIWAGRRFLNRAAGILTGEFWKQSSGMGAGFEMNLDSGHKTGIAIVAADPEAGFASEDRPVDGERTTVSSLDLYYYGVKALGGSFDFDAKLMTRADEALAPNDADSGFGVSVTYNRDYYGLDGWSQTAIAYGEGLGTNRGVNFGGWSGAWLEDSKSLFFTTYGVLNISDNWQMGTELTYWAPKDMDWGLTGNGTDEVTRYIFAARPTYKVNDNFRWEFTGSWAVEDLNGNQWGRKDSATDFYTLEAASVFTVNADYFGRPQLKPYVTWVGTSDEAAAGAIGITEAGEKDQFVFGVHAEIWF
ncbi:maltoporin [Photobacterium aquae]|uniref:Maltoporin n=1 Tax=Photobacterium aquae TaxID=1195763 RepID=A0A0J1H5F4_9GAMM|nr:carbohydrate porin [Photobacterium aquae]KLV06960.1 maltoporin [Photobacterium aquae]